VFLKFSLLFISARKQFGFVNVIPKYLNFAIFVRVRVCVPYSCMRIHGNMLLYL
jgi:hypothetical protein